MGSSTRWVYSSISPQLKKNALKKILFFAVPAVFLLVLSAFFFTQEMLTRYGMPLFSFVLILITYGVKPYRKFIQLEAKPHKLGISEKNTLIFFSKGSLLIEIPLDHIEQLSYIETRSLYGIALYLKPLHKLNTKYAHWQKKSQKYAKGCCLFFPYFRKEALKRDLCILSEVDKMDLFSPIHPTASIEINADLS